jgi:hypothetical protein
MRSTAGSHRRSGLASAFALVAASVAAVGASAAPLASFAVDPTWSFIRQETAANGNIGPHAGPLVIRLADIGLAAGDEITLAQGGNAFYAPDLEATFPAFRNTIGSLHAVFAASAVVVEGAAAETTTARVAAPIALLPAQLDYGFVSDPTVTGRQPTDIAEDFFVFRPGAIFAGFLFQGSLAVVPADAEFLLVGTLDTFADDNVNDRSDPLRVDIHRGFLNARPIAASAASPLASLGMGMLALVALRARRRGRQVPVQGRA